MAKTFRFNDRWPCRCERATFVRRPASFRRARHRLLRWTFNLHHRRRIRHLPRDLHRLSRCQMAQAGHETPQTTGLATGDAWGASGDMARTGFSNPWVFGSIDICCTIVDDVAFLSTPHSLSTCVVRTRDGVSSKPRSPGFCFAQIAWPWIKTTPGSTMLTTPMSILIHRCSILKWNSWPRTLNSTHNHVEDML